MNLINTPGEYYNFVYVCQFIHKFNFAVFKINRIFHTYVGIFQVYLVYSSVGT